MRVLRRATSRLLPMLLLASLTLAACQPTTEGGATASNSASVYDRVLASGKIRAAYITYPPALMRDANGQMSGIFVDVLEQAARNLGLEVEWTEEVGWGDQITGLMSDRYDIVGSPVWANPTRGKLAGLSIPVYYSGIGVYVRAGETRFGGDAPGRLPRYAEALDQGGIRIATIDGETGDLIARSDFPNAERVSLPQLSDISQLFLNVATNKADVLFAEPYYGYEYLKNNPGSVKNIASANPIRVFGNVYMFKPHEAQLKQMLDVAIEDLLNSGFVEKAIQKYEPEPGLFYRVARPYAPIG